MEKIVLIDGNSLLNRAFYATPPFTTKDGIPTNGVFGFVKLMLKIIADKNPTHFAVAFDLHAPTFRHKLYTDYKAGRKPMPEDLAIQMPILKEILSLMQIQICQMEGYEADDILGTLAKKFKIPTFIYTGDRDAYQLVDETTTVCFTRKGVSDILELTTDNFKDETGFIPSQIIDLKALMGDKSDNIPGVAGVGEKSAKTLLEKYFDVDGVYAHLDEITGALHDKLEKDKQNAYFSKQLATIDTNSPIDVSLSNCILKMPFSKAVLEKFTKLEFKSLLTLDVFTQENETTADVSMKKKGEITEKYPVDVAEAVAIINNSTAEYIAANVDDNGLRFALFEKEWTIEKDVIEYVFPIKTSLLDTGFFENELIPLFQAIYCGQKRVIVYNAKEVMRRLNSFNIVAKSHFEDVSILKCLAEGLGNVDTLGYCLNIENLPEDNKAYGLFVLYKVYYSRLSLEELKLYQDVELPLINVLFAMEQQGVCVNAQALTTLAEKYKTEIELLKKEICILAGEEFNVNSTQQLGKILFEKLKIGSGTKKTKEKKNYKTTAEELEKYADTSEIVRKILRYRKIQKIYSTYIEGFRPLIKNGKVHTTYNQSNTATGRLSSANPNLQNIPVRTDEGKELRKLFTASDGCVLIDADYSQIELRLLAHFSACKQLVLAYCNGEDIHALTASQVFNVPIEMVTSAQRRDAKAVNFGIIYGISAFGLSNDLHISAKRAKEYIDKYFERYSTVKEYMESNVDFAAKNGFVKTLLGRRRVINEIRSSNFNVRSFGERAAMNMPLQGSSADIIKIAMINVYNRLKEGKFKAKLVLQVHDELIIDCPKNEVEEVSKLLKFEMENAVQLTVPLTVDVQTGNTWFDTK